MPMITFATGLDFGVSILFAAATFSATYHGRGFGSMSTYFLCHPDPGNGLCYFVDGHALRIHNFCQLLINLC